MTGDGPIGDTTFRTLLEAAPFRDCLSRPVAVAVSGGSDSTALLYLLTRTLGGGAVTALTVDHGLRPDSAVEAQQVARVASDLGAAHVTLTWEGDKPTSDIQAAARAARYRLMSDWCLSHSVSHLFLGHTLDDQAETFLLRLARGSGVDGLSAMAPVTGAHGIHLLRPLLSVPKHRLQETLRAAGIRWIEDPSNRNDEFARVKARQTLPLLSGLGLSVERLAATADRMATAKEALDGMERQLRAACVQPYESGFVVLDRGPFQSAPREIGLRLLASLTRDIGGNTYRPRFDRLERLFDVLCAGDLTGGQTLAGCRFMPHPKNPAEVIICRELRSAQQAHLVFSQDGTGDFDGRFDVTIRNLRPDGDFDVKVLGEEGWQQVKSLVETTLPFEVRLTIPALWHGNTVVAAPHLGFSIDIHDQTPVFTADFRHFSAT